MKPTLLALSLALALSGCGSAAPAIEPAAAPLVAPAAVSETVLVGAESPDEALRYQPPPRGPASAFALPAPVHLRVSGGPEADLVVRPEVPILHVVVSWSLPERGPVEDLFFCALLPDLAPPSGGRLRDELSALGARVEAFGCDRDGTHLAFDLLPTQLEAMLDLLSTTLRAGSVPAQKLADERVRWTVDLDFASPEARARRALDERFFPAGHPYRRARYAPAAILRKVTLADLDKLRLGLRPANLVLSVAGALTPAVLQEQLARFTAAWPAAPAKPAPAAAPLRPAKAPEAQAPGHGITLIDEPGATEVELAVAFPVSVLGSPLSAAAIAARTLLQQRWAYQGKSGKVTRWSKAELHLERDLLASTLRVTARVPPGGVAVALGALRAEIDRLDTAPPPEAELRVMRAELFDWIERRWSGGLTIADRVSYHQGLGTTVDADVRLGQGIVDLDADAIRSFARTELAAERAMIVAVGPVSAEKEALAALGLGKVELIAAPAPPKGGRR